MTFGWICFVTPTSQFQDYELCYDPLKTIDISTGLGLDCIHTLGYCYADVRNSQTNLLCLG